MIANSDCQFVRGNDDLTRIADNLIMCQAPALVADDAPAVFTS